MSVDVEEADDEDIIDELDDRGYGVDELREQLDNVEEGDNGNEETPAETEATKSPKGEKKKDFPTPMLVVGLCVALFMILAQKFHWTLFLIVGLSAAKVIWWILTTSRGVPKKSVARSTNQKSVFLARNGLLIVALLAAVTAIILALK